MFETLRDATRVHMGKVTLNGTAAVASSAIDLRGATGCEISLVTGTISDAGTASGYTVKLQHSDTLVGTDFTDVVAAETPNGVVSITNTVDTDDDKVIGVLGYTGAKRYVRVVATGTTLSAGDVHPIARLAQAARPAALTAAASATT
jgi:hypothetical protein